MSTTTEKPARWTPAAIRKATPFPKPKGEVAKERAFNRGGVSRDLSSLERRLLRAIISKADLLDPVTKDERGNKERWLLVPARQWMLDLMAVFEVEREDLEDCVDREPEETGGGDYSGRIDGEDEPSLGSNDANMNQGVWAHGNDGGQDLELDDCDAEEDGTLDPDLGWEHWTPISGPQRPPKPTKRVKGKPHDHPTLGRYQPL